MLNFSTFLSCWCLSLALLPSLGFAQESETRSDPWVPTASPERISRSVFTVKVTYKKDRTTARQHERSTNFQYGFLLEEDLGITSYAGLRGAKSLKVFLDSRRGIGAKLIGADPKNDLAVLRLNPAGNGQKPGDAPKPSHLPLVENAVDYALGDEFWILFRGELSVEASRPIPYSELALKSAPERVQAGAVTRRLGGLPAVDRDGGLIGMWRWSLPSDGSVEVRVTEAQVLRKLAASFQGEGAVSSPARTYSGFPKRSYTFPSLSWKSGSSKGAAGKAMKNAGKLRQDVGCPRCKQQGVIIRQGKEMRGRKYVPVTTRTKCYECDGSRMVRPLSIWRKVRTLAASLTAVSPTDENIGNVERRLEESIAAAVSLGPRVFIKRLNDSAVQAVDPATLVPGQSIFIGMDSKNWSHDVADGWGEDVRFLEAPNWHIILIHPTSRNIFEEGQDALIVGTIAGFVTIGDHNWTVLERPIVVPIRLDGEKTGR